MKKKLTTLAQSVNTVTYIHAGPNEEIIAVLINSDWLNTIWEAAAKGGYKDPNCTQSGQEDGFMPHDHVVLE
jgi:hypothetical protein